MNFEFNRGGVIGVVVGAIAGGLAGAFLRDAEWGGYLFVAGIIAFGMLGNAFWSGSLKASTNDAAMMMVLGVEIMGVITFMTAQTWPHLWIGLSLMAVAAFGIGILSRIHQQRLAENPFGPRRFALKLCVPGIRFSFKLVPWLLFAFALMTATWAVTMLVYGDFEGLMAAMFLLSMVMALLAFNDQSRTYQTAFSACWGVAGLAGLVGVMISPAGWTLEMAKQVAMCLGLVMLGGAGVWGYAFARFGIHQQGISGSFGPLMSWDECKKWDLEEHAGRQRLAIERARYYYYRVKYEVAAEDVDGLRAFLELHVPNGTASNV